MPLADLIDPVKAGPAGAALRIVCETREDGSVIVSSPGVPLFYITGPDPRTALVTALPILAEMIERNPDMPLPS